MKSDNLIIVAMLAAAGFMVLKGRQAKTGAASVLGGFKGSLGNVLQGLGLPAATFTNEILDNGKPWSNGWRYFSDGTSIGPDGVYYYQGQQVYDPNNYGSLNAGYDNATVDPINLQTF